MQIYTENHVSNCHPYGCGNGFSNPATHEMRVGSSTRKSCVRNLHEMCRSANKNDVSNSHPHGCRSGGELHEMSRYAQKIMFLILHPWGWVEWWVKYKWNFFVRNCMKYLDLHRKVACMVAMMTNGGGVLQVLFEPFSKSLGGFP